LLVLTLTAGCGYDVPSANEASEAADRGDAVWIENPDGRPTYQAVITKVVDGDTIEADYTDPTRPDRDPKENIRILAMDAPETKHPTKGVECYGPQAAARLGELLPEGAEVTLVEDADRFDDSGRPLVYVERDGVDIGLMLLTEGLARWAYVEPNDDRLAGYKEAEGLARSMRLGLWGACRRAEQWAEGGFGRDG
jgi:micrococcal nuclease